MNDAHAAPPPSPSPESPDPLTPTDPDSISEGRPPFRFHHPVPVRFRDIDVGGHAHHSHALAYFEEARWAFWTQLAGRPAEPEGVDYILAEARVRYHARVLYPQTLQVGVRVVAVGRKRVEMEYEARSPGGELLVSGSTTLVLYDYGAGRSAPVPDELRARLEAHAGIPLPRRMDPSG
jgi:acyl-CoA thioester hydrolase